jgi:hypothetical protein
LRKRVVKTRTIRPVCAHESSKLAKTKGYGGGKVTLSMSLRGQFEDASVGRLTDPDVAQIFEERKVYQCIVNQITLHHRFHAAEVGLPGLVIKPSNEHRTTDSRVSV